MARLFFITLALSLLSVAVHAFVRVPVVAVRTTTTSRYSLDNDTIEKLEEMRSKFDRLSNVVSEDASAEKAKMQDIVEKYGTYREIKNMMGRLRQMWRSEASENRKARQLKSFVELYKGRMQIEDLLKEKLGMSTRKSAETIKELEDIEKWDKVTWPAFPFLSIPCFSSIFSFSSSTLFLILPSSSFVLPAGDRGPRGQAGAGQAGHPRRHEHKDGTLRVLKLLQGFAACPIEGDLTSIVCFN
jgi:hypothetical protein